MMALETYNSPFTLISIIASQSSLDPDSILSSPCALPALLIKISTVLNPFGKLFSSEFTLSLSRTSKQRVCTFVCKDSSFAIASSRSWRLPHKIKLMLFLANKVAVARPIPEVAPVIRAVFFIRVSKTKIAPDPIVGKPSF